MFLHQFYTGLDAQVVISAEQASSFAKDIAGDFNPLHDTDAKRFCVPGDLLFSIVLEKYGLNKQMSFTFAGMVGRDVPLNFPESDANILDICDDAEKAYLHVNRNGSNTRNSDLIEAFLREYVAFSGPNFPHVLVPLMAEHNVMINTERPLVIYESMSFELDHLDFSDPQLEAADTDLEVNGKRGVARLHFDISADSKIVGRGFKRLLISGMREYDYDVIQEFVDNYLARMDAYNKCRTAAG